jgi:hypothetical protein
MSDFQQRLRDAVVERSEGFEASADLPDRIAGRVRRRQVRRQLVAGGVVAAAAAVAVVVGLVATGGEDEGSIRMSDDDSVTTTARDVTTTTGGPTATEAGAGGTGISTTTTSTSTPTSTTPVITTSLTLPEPPFGTGLNPYLTPLNRSGIGAIRAGMTLRQAQDAGRVTFVTSAPNGAGTCREARFQEAEDAVVVLVEPAGADPLDGMVRAVIGSVLGTDEGAMVGQSRAELLAVLGAPTRTEAAPYPWDANDELLVFEAGGFAYGALVVDDMVLDLQSGDPAWVTNIDGCPG